MVELSRLYVWSVVGQKWYNGWEILQKCTNRKLIGTRPALLGFVYFASLIYFLHSVCHHSLFWNFKLQQCFSFPLLATQLIMLITWPVGSTLRGKDRGDARYKSIARKKEEVCGFD